MAEKMKKKLTLKPFSLLSSSALRAEQLTVWYATSVADTNRGSGFENNWASSVSSWIVFTSCLYPAYLYGWSSETSKKIIS